MTIKLMHVSVKKGITTVLDDIHLDINEGENWAILGENGSGKTTLLNVLAGAEHASRGTVEKRKDLKIELLANTFKHNRLVSKAYQYYQQRYTVDGAALAPTAYEVVQNQVKPLNTVNDASVVLPPKPYFDVAVQEWADVLKIKHLLHHSIVTLSNGETRRVLLLTALLKKPDILLLDNPFVGLDVASRQILHTILGNIMASGIQIVLVCAASEIPEGITDAIILKDGKTADILRGPQIAEIKRQQIAENSTNKTILNQNILSKIKEQQTHNDFEYAVRFRNTTVQYGGEKVVNGINWDIKKGERWALMGPNGSGKSTLLSLITADNPQGYRNDFDIFDRKRGSGESIWQIKKRIGFVSPELHLYADARIPVWKIIASGLFDVAELHKSLTAKEAETVADYIKLFDLQGAKDKLLQQLSSGQQRLVFLARALVKNPPLLILDEPCQGLDPEHIAYFRALINELVVSLDKTLIYVTHYETEIPACVNQIFRIKNGRRNE